MAERGNSRGGSSRGSRKKDDLSVKVVLGPCRLSFPHFFKPAETDGGDRYQANFLFPPKSDFSKLDKAMDDCMLDFFGPKDDWPRGKQDRLPEDVVRRAEEKEYEGYVKGWYFIKASSKDPIGIVDANREEITNEREVYGGRWCRVSVTVKAYDNKSKGIGVYLNSVQMLDHDDQFGGRGPARNDFDDWDGPALSDDDRGDGRGNARDRDDDRGRDRDDDRRGSSRDRDDRGRDRDDDRGSRSRDRDDAGDRRGRDREDRSDDRGRDRDRDDRGSSRGRDRDDDRGRDRDTRDDRGSGRDDRSRDDRGSSRDRDDRGRDDDRGSRRSSRDDDRGRDRDDDRRPSRDRDDDRGRDRNWN